MTQATAGGQEPVLVVTSTFPLAIDDGMPRFVLDLAEALADHFSVSVLAPDAPKADRQERLGRLEITRFGYFWPRGLQRLAYGAGMPHNLRHSLLAKLQALPFLTSEILAIRAVASRSAARWVNAHWLVPQGLAAALARRQRSGWRIALHVHSTDVHLLARLPLGGAIARFVVPRCQLVLATSNYVRDKLDELLGYPSQAVIRPMGVNCELFQPQGGETPELAELVELRRRFPGGFVLFVGRLVPVKGLTYLIEAMSRVLKVRSGVGLVVVGSGPERVALGQEAERRLLAEAIEFVGPKSHGEVVDYMRACRVVAIPSVVEPGGETEGMPTVVLEAMAAGARVVGSAVGGIPDLIRHGENGWLCRQRDPEELADMLSRALTEPDSSGIEHRARKTARRHDWREVARQYAELLYARRSS